MIEIFALSIRWEYYQCRKDAITVREYVDNSRISWNPRSDFAPPHMKWTRSSASSGHVTHRARHRITTLN